MHHDVDHPSLERKEARQLASRRCRTPQGWEPYKSALYGNRCKCTQKTREARYARALLEIGAFKSVPRSSGHMQRTCLLHPASFVRVHRSGMSFTQCLVASAGCCPRRLAESCIRDWGEGFWDHVWALETLELLGPPPSSHAASNQRAACFCKWPQPCSG